MVGFHPFRAPEILESHLKNISHILYVKSLRLIITLAATVMSGGGSSWKERQVQSHGKVTC